MRRSVLVKVPSFSRLGLAGRITSAKRQVSLKKISCMTKKSSFDSASADIIGVGIDQAHLFAEDIHRLEFAFVDGVDHHVVIEARLRRQCNIPCLLKLGPNRRIVHFLIAGKVSSASRRDRWRPARCCVRAGDRRRFPASCNCRWPAADWRSPSRCRNPWQCCVTPIAQRTQTPSASAIMWATLVSVSIGSPHRSLAISSVKDSRLFLYSSEPIDPLIDELLVGKSVVEDVLGHRGEPDEIGAGPRMQEHIRAPRHLVLAKVGDDQLLAVHLVGALDARRQHRMALGGIAADDQHQARLAQYR